MAFSNLVHYFFVYFALVCSLSWWSTKRKLRFDLVRFSTFFRSANLQMLSALWCFSAKRIHAISFLPLALCNRYLIAVIKPRIFGPTHFVLQKGKTNLMSDKVWKLQCHSFGGRNNSIFRTFPLIYAAAQNENGHLLSKLRWAFLKIGRNRCKTIYNTGEQEWFSK